MSALPASKLVVTFSSCPLKERLAARLCGDYARWVGGYRTYEARSAAGRGGYELEAIGGARVQLASKELLSPVAFNKYGLNLAALETTALAALETAAAAGRVLVMDELGPMALCSAKFSARAVDLLFSSSSCLVFCRRGAKLFEDAFLKMDGVVRIDLTEPGWAEAVAAATAWFDARIPFMENNDEIR